MKSNLTRFIQSVRSCYRLGAVAFMMALITSGSLQAQVFTYQENFPNGTLGTGSQQCVNWTSFRAQLASGLPYYRLAMSTSANSTVMECNNATIVALIAQALRTGAAGTWVDGSNTWNVGGCGSGPELSVNSGNCSCPSPGWVVRPCIGNNNWGGIGTATCGGPTQTMKVEFFANQEDHDLKMDQMLTPFSACGQSNDPVSFLVKNWGQNDESNIPFVAEVTGTINGSPINQTLNYTYTGTLASLGQTNITFGTTINTNGSGTLTFKIYSSLGTDDDRTNDTILVVKNFLGSPNSPGVTNVDRCGVGSVNLVATPGSSNDVIRWHSAPTGGTLLGTGANITSPPFYASTTIYADASRDIATNTFTNSPTLYTYLTNNPSLENGGMMDITPKQTLMINSISAIKVNAGTASWKVYMRTGSYVGNQTNPGAWTLVGTSTNVSGTTNSFTSINIGNIVLQAGVTYGFYIQCLGSDVWATYYGTAYTGFTSSNADLTYVGGTQLYGPFGQNGQWPNYNMNVRFNYTTMCLSNRVPVNVTIKPVPKNTTHLKGATFNGLFASGNVLDPDITASADVVSYDLQSPSGYPNAQHGVQWTSSVTVRTPAGTNFPTGNYTVTPPSASGNGSISINPPAGYSDSTLLVTYTITAGGCDTVITRRLFIAPRPVAGFTTNPVCEGAGMKFTNTTVLTSGTIAYTWNFGDGGSSTHINPTHAYATAGTYNVTLTAVSNYGYSNVANMTVTVYENPTAEFAHTNVCLGAVTPFFDGSLIPAGTPTYVWDFGDGTAFGSGSNPTHQYATTGVYTVKMRVTANGCSDETTRYVTYSPRAVPDFTPLIAGCNNDPVSFTNNTTLSNGQVGYTWEFGENNATSTQKHTSYEYSGYGNFNVKLTATTDMGCVNTITKTINLTEAPRVSFTNTSLCDVDQVDFTNTSSEPVGAVTTYEWFFSDGEDFSTKDVTKNFNGVAQYTVILKAHATNGCIDEMTKVISIDESPRAEFYADDVCTGTNVQLNNATIGNNGNVNYAWDLGAAGTSNAKDPNISLPVGTHNIKLTVTTPGGCSDEVINTVTVHAIPTAQNVDISTANMGDGTVILTADVATGVNYLVFWGDGQRDQGVSNGSLLLPHTYTLDGKFFVEVRVDKNDCHSITNTSTTVLRTGLVSAAAGELRVYPNPSNGQATLDVSGLTYTSIEVAVFGINGQRIPTNIEVENGLAVLDLGTKTPGVYWVRVTTDQGQYYTKLTVVN